MVSPSDLATIQVELKQMRREIDALKKEVSELKNK